MESTNRQLTGVDRAAAAFLLLLMGLGSLLLWVGVPAGWLWLAGKITSTQAEHFMLAVLGTPVAIIAWAKFLFWLNRLYMRVTLPAQQITEEDDLDEEDEPRWVRGPLEVLLVVSLVIASAAMLFWFFVYAENPGAWVF